MYASYTRLNLYLSGFKYKCTHVHETKIQDEADIRGAAYPNTSSISARHFVVEKTDPKMRLEKEAVVRIFSWE